MKFRTQLLLLLVFLATFLAFGSFGETVECMTTPGMTARIIGGSSSDIKRYPYYVFCPGLCGGLLIAPRLVLTAAHCVGAPENPVTSYIGKTVTIAPDAVIYSDNVASTQGGQKRKVVNVLAPGDLGARTSPQDFYNDVVMLVLDKPATRTPIKLRKTMPTPGSVVTIVGHGISGIKNGTPTIPKTLKKLQATVISREQAMEGVKAAKKAFPFLSTSPSFLTSPYHVFAIPQVNSSAGTGDSGGPIVMRKGGPTKDVAIAIVHQGISADIYLSGNKPSSQSWMVEGYVSISKNLPWIQKQAKRMGQSLRY